MKPTTSQYLPCDKTVYIEKTFSDDSVHIREPEPRLIWFVGSPPDNLGRDGDFTYDEEDGLYFGPRKNGYWPEEPVKIPPSLRKKKLFSAQEIWAENRKSDPPPPEKNVRWLLKTILTFLLTGRIRPEKPHYYSVHLKQRR